MTDCIFCKVAKGEIESKKVYEDDLVVAFHDINKKAPVHILVIPKKHIASLLESTPEDTELMGKLIETATKLAKEHNIAESGVIINVAMRNEVTTKTAVPPLPPCSPAPLLLCAPAQTMRPRTAVTPCTNPILNAVPPSGL